ncbi:hypothetical protein HP550_14565 [Cellulomonas humilata]|uniref:Uncharacterized protein n=1 Tax=Cellulomonas humilata TaxID=144055 RepID=A0A7Y6A2G2_9CELL|nr:hypothetical protein [Cellulomonas humilata]NUU18477.1 hypothetical protein [Cellulomonas humilata]
MSEDPFAPEPFLIVLGKVVMELAILESSLIGLIGQLRPSADASGDHFIKKVYASTTATIRSELAATATRHEDNHPAVVALSEGFGALADRRNLFIHGVWTDFDPERNSATITKQDAGVRRSKKLADARVSTTITLEEFLTFADEVERLNRETARIWAGIRGAEVADVADGEPPRDPAR